jgi:enterochelin esterase-like enzyme
MALLASGCASSTNADAGIDAGTPPVLVTPARVSGWEDRLLTYQVTSSVEGIASRQVTVLLPPGYGDAANAAVRYPVFYMHDGQNCLDHDAFAHGGWQVHTISTDLITTGKMKPVLFVFVDTSTTQRAAEYVRGMGTAPGPTADGYLDFLERDVVPWVDRTWRTQATAAGRGIGGSSYGGIVSLDAAWRRSTWSTVMSMSTAFGYDFTAYAAGVPKLPLRVYLDSGTTDYSGGDDDMTLTIALRDLLVGKGWVLGTDLQHVIGQGDSHSENYWRGRLPGALSWLYAP